MKIALLTNDKYLEMQFSLELGDKAEISREIFADTDLALYDCESSLPLPSFDGRVIKLSRNPSGNELELPLPYGTLESLICQTGGARLTVFKDSHSCSLDGRIIKLTSVEHKLLSLLADGGGELVSREEISKKVWGGAADGLINIYVHYLREKLERGGERIIVSSRKGGYAVNKSYLGGAEC